MRTSLPETATTSPHATTASNWTEAERALARRVRVVAIAVISLFPLAWGIWQWPFSDGVDRAGTPMGGDFPVFYVAARMLSRGQAAQLYDFQAQYRVLHQLFPALDAKVALPFLYPPFVAAAVRPLGLLSYPAAFGVFTLLSALLWWGVISMLQRQLTLFRSLWRGTGMWWLIGAPLLWETLLGGQSSVWACAILVATLALLRRDRWMAAGFVLALATYKPNALAFVGLGLVVRYPRLILGGLAAAPILLVVGLVGAGSQATAQYLTLYSNPAARAFVSAPPFEKYHGLANVDTWLRGTAASSLFVVGGAVLAIAIGALARRTTRPAISSFAVGMLSVIQSLFNPYLPIYDLLPLVVGAVFLADDAISRGGSSLGRHAIAAHLILALVFIGPHVSQAMASVLHLQLFSLLLLAAALWYTSRTHDAPATGGASTSPQ